MRFKKAFFFEGSKISTRVSKREINCTILRPVGHATNSIKTKKLCDDAFMSHRPFLTIFEVFGS